MAPPWLIASRALTAMLTIASSSSLTSTRTGHTSGRIVVTIFDDAPSTLPGSVRVASTRLARLTTVGLQALPAGEGQQLARKSCAALRGKLDRFRRAQSLRISADPLFEHVGCSRSRPSAGC